MKGSVRKRGNCYQYYFDIGTTPEGKRKRKTKSGFKTKNDAERELRIAIQQFENGYVTNELYYHEFLNYYIDNYVELNCKYNTVRLYKSLIRNHLSDISHYKLSKLNNLILQEFLNNKYKSGISKNTLLAIHRLLNSSIKYAHSIGCINNNPMINVKCNYKYELEEKQIISYEVMRSILRYFEPIDSYFIPLSIGFYTGMRLGEILSLKWCDVDLHKNTININSTMIYKDDGTIQDVSPKTKSSIRIITIPNKLSDILKEYKTRNKNDYICISLNGDRLNKKHVEYMVNKINKQFNIKFNFHQLRHLHGTTLLESGVNIKSVSKRLGHASVNITYNTYIHLTDKIEKETIDILNKL